MRELLLRLNACEPAIKWAEGKSWKEIFEQCPRGDWLLWLFRLTKDESENDFALLTIAKGYCANTVRHLMKDQRSLNAVNAAINYNGDRISLKTAAKAAYAAYTKAKATYTKAKVAYATKVASAKAAYAKAKAAYADATKAAFAKAAYAADAAESYANKIANLKQ